MTYDEDPFRRRPRKSTATWKWRERCVWITENWVKWASENGQITKIALSEGCGGKPIPVVVKFL